MNVEEKQGGKFLTFRLEDEWYGVNVEHILQIIAIPDITPVPKTPDFVKGVINLRGKIIPVIDLRKKFHLEEKEYNQRTSIIVFSLNKEGKSLFIGCIVDTVLEVLDIHSENIEEKPEFGVQVHHEFIYGMTKAKEKVITLLDVEQVLTNQELVTIKETVGS